MASALPCEEGACMRMLADHLHLQLFVNPFSAFRRNGQWLKNMFTLAVLRLSAPLFLGVAVVAELCRHAMADGHRHGLQGPNRPRAQYGPDQHPPAVRGNALQRRGQACRCLERRAVPLTDCQRVAFVSLAFNVRNKAFCRSTLVRKTNPGDIDGVCAELSPWTNAARLSGCWVLNGWRAGARIAYAENLHSKQVQAQTQKAQAATEIK